MRCQVPCSCSVTFDLEKMNLQEFRQFAREEFSYLVADFGFEETPVPKDANEFQVRFETERTRIAVEGINWGSNIDIRIASTDDDEMKYSSYCFHDLLVVRAVDLEYPKPEDSSWAGDIQTEQMKVFSKALRQHASDILDDDHSIFPELAACIDRRVR